MNRVRFEGRLGRDPEHRTTSTGKSLAKFSLVVRDARNESQNFFFDCTAWEPVASQVSTNCKKNDLISVDGRLTTNIYTNREGKSVKTYDIIVESMKMLSRGASTSASPSASRPKAGYVSIDEIDDIATPLPAKQNMTAPSAPAAKPDPVKAKDDDFGVDWLKDLDE